jgi:hypothetical protein
MSRSQSTCARETGWRGDVRRRWRRATTRLATGVLVLAACLTAVTAAAQPAPSSPASAASSALTPGHVFVTPCLRPLVEEMLQRSPTFRAQMERLKHTPALGVAISLKAEGPGHPAHASIRHYDSGLMLAHITIQRLDNKEELIAHEIEHVLEQIDRVPLARLARAGTVAWSTGGSYETKRAIYAGRRVAKELRDADVLGSQE